MKYIFNKDVRLGTYVVPGSAMPVNIVTFKKGDIVDGVMIKNEKSSEPPTFIETITPKGKVRIDFGGRAGSHVMLDAFPPLETESKKTGDVKTPPTAPTNTTATQRNLFISVSLY